MRTHLEPRPLIGGGLPAATTTMEAAATAMKSAAAESAVETAAAAAKSVETTTAEAAIASTEVRRTPESWSSIPGRGRRHALMAETLRSATEALASRRAGVRPCTVESTTVGAVPWSEAITHTVGSAEAVSHTIRRTHAIARTVRAGISAQGVLARSHGSRSVPGVQSAIGIGYA